MTDNELTIALLDIQTKIAACHAQEHGEPWRVCATLRHKAMDIVANFVDPCWADEQAGIEHPPLRDGIAMSLERDGVSPF